MTYKNIISNRKKNAKVSTKRCDKMLNKKICFITLSLVSALYQTQLSAQSIDYSSLEKLFGEPVTSSASGKPERISDVPLTMEIITQEDIRRSGATTISEALRQVNGVNVIQKTASMDDVSIRGYNQHFSQRILVMVNGRQVYIDTDGYTNWNDIPVQLSEIKQIEIVKGSNTALYGFNAVNGVINIITYNPKYDNKNSVTVMAGTQAYRGVNGVKTFSINDKIQSRLSFSYKRSNEFDSILKGGARINLSMPDRIGFHNPEAKTINSDTLFQLTNNSELRLELSATTSETGTIYTNGVPINLKTDTQSVKTSYVNDSSLGLIKANIYKNFGTPTVGILSILPSWKLENELFVSQLEDTIALNNHHVVRLQGEYRQNKMDYGEGFWSPKGAEISYDVWSGSGMWEWKTSDTTTLTNAVRVDRLLLEHNGILSTTNPSTKSDYDNTLTSIGYNVAFNWKASDNDTVRLITSRGVEIPSLLEYSYDIPIVQAYGNPYSKPVVITNYEIAWDKKISALDGLFRSALFYNQSRDVKGTVRAPSGFQSYEALGDSDSYGIELSLNGKLNENFNWGAGYVFQRIDDDFSPNNLSKDFEAGNAQHLANLKLGYQKGPWETDALVYYTSSTKAVSSNVGLITRNLVDVDPYVGVNGRVAYNFPYDVTVAAHGQQLQSSRVQTSNAPEIERRLLFSLSKTF